MGTAALLAVLALALLCLFFPGSGLSKNNSAILCESLTTRARVVSTADEAATLGEDLHRCPGLEFNVYWRGSIRLSQSLKLTHSTTLQIVGESAETSVVDGDENVALFVVSDLSALHLEGLGLTGAVYVDESSSFVAGGVAFTGTAEEVYGGSLHAQDRSTSTVTSTTTTQSGQTSLFHNNFNAAGIGNYDTSGTDGRSLLEPSKGGPSPRRPFLEFAKPSEELSEELPSSPFLELAKERFEAYNGRAANVIEEHLSFDELQLIRVPKAASSEASVVARRLGGCMPRGACCKFPGSPPGSCPMKGLVCPSVTGCADHQSPDGRVLADRTVFTMSNLRDVVDRMVSGFFYTPPHSPRCAQKSVVEYEGCFKNMITNPTFQNIAARMMSGHAAYDGTTKICLEKQEGGGVGEGEDAAGRCDEDLKSVIRGACKVNFITMSEAWETSILILFEVLPWLGPTPSLFPLPRPALNEPEIVVLDGSRHNTGAKHEEGAKHITPELRELARRANSVDEALHEFVSAKFCDRLREAGLLDHPLVAEELATYELLDQRCNDAAWVTNTLERFGPMTPEDCRLYRPFAKPKKKFKHKVVSGKKYGAA